MTAEYILIGLGVPPPACDLEEEKRNHWTVRYVRRKGTDGTLGAFGASCGPYAVDLLTQDRKRYTLMCRLFSGPGFYAVQRWYWPSNRIDEGVEHIPTQEEIVSFLLQCMAENGNNPSRDVKRVYDGPWRDERIEVEQ